MPRPRKATPDRRSKHDRARERARCEREGRPVPAWARLQRRKAGRPPTVEDDLIVAGRLPDATVAPAADIPASAEPIPEPPGTTPDPAVATLSLEELAVETRRELQRGIASGSTPPSVAGRALFDLVRVEEAHGVLVDRHAAETETENAIGRILDALLSIAPPHVWEFLLDVVEAAVVGNDPPAPPARLNDPLRAYGRAVNEELIGRFVASNRQRAARHRHREIWLRHISRVAEVAP